MEFDYRRPYHPLVPTLEQFSSEHGATLTFVIDPEPWTDPHYRMVWLNSGGQMCSLRVHWHGDDEFEARVHRWGVHRLIGERAWRFHSTDTAGSELVPILEETWTWCEETRPE
jgi:hypothetical protein